MSLCDMVITVSVGDAITCLEVTLSPLLCDTVAMPVNDIVTLDISCRLCGVGVGL